MSLGYELYWHDRANQGFAGWPVRCVLKTLEDGSTVVGMDETSYIPIALGVSENYRGSGGMNTFLEQYYGDNAPNYTVNTAKTSAAAEQTLRVAKQVVEDNAGKTDMGKLYAYKDWICDNVAYDEAQSAYVGTETDLGDSSQATNVFDEDPSTKVVCEGYAKAFKLLCDLSDFQDETLVCNFVMGPASGYSGGSYYGEDHMWNIVTYNGRNYIVDVTNTDEGSVGESGVYFMVGGNRISSWSGFGYSMSGNYLKSSGEGGMATRVNHSMTYKYDDDTQDAYTTAALTIDANSPAVFDTIEGAGRYVAEQMKARETMINVSYTGSTSSIDPRTAIVEAAFKHTGIAGEGDNLKRQIDSYVPATSNNTVIYDCAYYDTASEVARFEEAAETVLAGMNLEGKSDYDKIKTVYDWVCRNIDYEHDYASALAPRHTASGALLGRAAVCEGYANLTYYFLLKAGIDNRIVVSSDHAWNIVKLGDVYYNIDTTWDAGRGYSYRPYRFFLKTDEYYTDTSWYEYNDHHIRLSTDDCSTQEFYDQYPMARYNYGEEPDMTEVTVSASFDDTDNPSVRPESVTITLNDGEYDYKIELNEENHWTGSASVPKNEDYTAVASAADGYTVLLTGDITNGYSAEYVLNHYTVKWVNDDETILEEDVDVAYGLIPEYNGEDPVKAETESFRYIFERWSPAIKAVTEDVTYTAVFRAEVKTNVSSLTIRIADENYVYDGTEKRPAVTVEDFYTLLTEGTDYSVAYDNNVNAGTATVTVTGLGRYTGTATRTFEIAKAEQTLTVTPSEVTMKVGETAVLNVEAETVATYASADETVATVENSIITAVGAGETTIIVTLKETENYNAATAICSVTVTEQIEEPFAVFEGTQLELEGKIIVDFFVEVPEEYAGAEVVMTTEDGTTRVPVEDGETSSYGNAKLYKYYALSTQMRDTITLYVEKDGNKVPMKTSSGTDYTNGYEYTILKSLDNYKNSSDENLVNLANAMDAFGQYVQILVKHNEEGLTSPQLEEVPMEDLDTYASTRDADLETLKYAGARLELNSDTTIWLYYQPAEGHTLNEYTFTVDNNEVTAEESGGYYILKIRNIKSNELGHMYSIKATDGANTQTLNYSALSYADSIIKKNSDVNNVNACKAIYWYYKMAVAYFDEA